MHRSVYLTFLVLISLLLPDMVSVISSNFVTLDAEIKFHKYLGEDIIKYRT